MPAALILELRKLIADLVAGNYGAIIADGRGGRLTEAEFRSAIEEYGRTLVLPPDSSYESVDEYPQDNAPDRTWLDVSLWTQEEGRSDLTLSVLATKRDGAYDLKIQDLHVL